MQENENIFNHLKNAVQNMHSLWKRTPSKLVGLIHVAFRNFCTF